MQELFDLQQYTGVWHELASLPQWFETQCESAVAVYSARDDTLCVANYCLQQGNIVSAITGIASVDGRYCDPRKLSVTFCNGATGTYWIHSTDYTMYSIVGNQQGTALWILSRNQTVDAEFRHRMLVLCDEIGVQTGEMRWR